MCPPGNPSCGSRADIAYSCQELEQEPIAQNDEGRYGDEEYENKRKNSCTRIENDVSAHDARDGAAGSERGKRRVKIKQNMG